MKHFSSTAALAVLVLTATGCQTSQPIHIAIGSYNPDSGAGLYTATVDPRSAEIRIVDSIAAVNPSFVTFDRAESMIYTVCESDSESDAVAAFALSRDGKFELEPLNTQLTAGRAPCYITLFDHRLYTANYNGGSWSVFDLTDDGSIQPLADTVVVEYPAELSHAHTIVPMPDGEHLVATDLGRSRLYTFLPTKDSVGRSTLLLTDAYQMPEGSGPRHVTFSTDGKRMYVLTEVSGEIYVFDCSGRLREIERRTADLQSGHGSADIHLSPDGLFLYASNRLKGDGIVIYSVDQTDGTLRMAGFQPTGRHPRNFAITPDGELLLVACRDDNRIELYRRNRKTGLLTDTGKRAELPLPTCITFID